MRGMKNRSGVFIAPVMDGWDVMDSLPAATARNEPAQTEQGQCRGSGHATDPDIIDIPANAFNHGGGGEAELDVQHHVVVGRQIEKHASPAAGWTTIGEGLEVAVHEHFSGIECVAP